MTEPENEVPQHSLARVVRVVDLAVSAKDHSRPAWNIWHMALNPPGGTERQRLHGTARALILLNNELDLATEELRRSPFKVGDYGDAVDGIRRGVSIMRLAEAFSACAGSMMGNNLAILRMASRVIPPKELANGDDLQALRNALENTFETVLKLPDDDPLHQFLIDEMLLMELALRDYVIQGSPPVRRAVIQFDAAMRAAAAHAQPIHADTLASASALMQTAKRFLIGVTIVTGAITGVVESAMHIDAAVGYYFPMQPAKAIGPGPTKPAPHLEREPDYTVEDLEPPPPS